MEVQPTLQDMIRKAQVGDKEIDEIKEKMKEDRAKEFREDEHGTLWYGDRLCVPSDLENAQLSRDLSLLHAEIFEALTDPNAEPCCPEWIEDVRVTDSQFDLMTVEQSDRPFGRVVLLVQVSYRTPRGMAFLPAD